MDFWNNILDENILKTNVNFAAMFVLNYECLKDFVVNQIRDFFADNIKFDRDRTIYEESHAYKDEVRSLDENIENASLKWFIQSDAITQSDYDTYQKIRKRRDDITHELLKNLNEGFKESDVKLFSDLLSIYSKLDKWWINEIEIPISGEDVPEDYDRESVCGGQAVELSIINSIILANKGNEYKDLLKTISEMNNPKLNEEGKCCEEGKSL